MKNKKIKINDIEIKIDEFESNKINYIQSSDTIEIDGKIVKSRNK